MRCPVTKFDCITCEDRCAVLDKLNTTPCSDCDDGHCTMNCGPWCPPGERYIGKTIEHVITEDDNGCFRVHHPATNVCLSLHGTPLRAFVAAERADEIASRSRAAVRRQGAKTA